jgi:protein-disulfide isomerase
MKRSFLLIAATALLFVMTGSGQNTPKKSALDKPTLEAYLRHLWVLDPQMSMTIADPQPSELPGFQDVKVKIAMGPQSQEVALMVSKDGAKVLQASVWDINSNPFKKDIDKLKTQFEPSIGTPGATVVIVAFSDFQCPYCKEEAQMLRKNLLAAFPTQVRLYFKTFPLESLHPWAKPAAIASRCVYQQDGAAFWEFHDWIFENQASTTPENLKDKVLEWAKARKDVDSLRLGQCIDTKATEPDVNATIAEAQSLGVGGTPTLFINGRKIDRTIDWPNLKRIIDDEIAYQKTAKDAGEDCGCDLKLNIPGMPSNGAPSGSPLAPKPPAASKKK